MSDKSMYIASPYGAIAKHIKDPKEARRVALVIATMASHKAVELGYIPFSPVLNFNNIYDEYKRPGDREKALRAGFFWLEQCDCLGWAETVYSDDSEGMKAEERRAYKQGKQVIIIEVV